MTLGRFMAGAGQRARADHDFYSTEEGLVTLALLNSPAGEVLRAMYPEIWEPACGTGAISRVLEVEGFLTHNSDIVDRGYGTQLDFLKATAAPAKAIVTNPPFTLFFDADGRQVPAHVKGGRRMNGHAAFLRQARELGVEFVAMFAKAQFWHAADRLALWDEWPPMAMLPITWRVDFTGEKNATMDTQWVVWWSRYQGAPTTYLLRKP